MMKKRWLFLFALFSALVLAACNSDKNGEGAAAKEVSDWPSKNMEFIVPYAEGGSADIMARGLASSWQKRLGHQIIIRNSAGGAGTLGAMRFLGASHDGQTFLVGSQPAISMNELIYGADFNIEDFKFINIEQRDYGTIIVPSDSPYETLDDLIEDIHNRPGKVTMSITAGAGHSLFGYAFVDELDLDVNIVTFSSGGEQRTDIIGGHSNFAVSGAHGDLAIGDKIRVLAVASDEEFPGWEGVPPVNEALAKYDVNPLPAVGDNRYIAVHRDFAEKNPEIFKGIVNSYKENFESDEYQKYIQDIGAATLSNYYGPEESEEIAMELHALVEKYADVLKGNN